MNPGDLLADRLRRLDTDTSSDNDVPVRVPDDPSHPSSLQHAGAPGDGYGFRPVSGFSSPSAPAPQDRNSPLPDVNGLGWPGGFSSFFLSFLPLTSHIHPPITAKSTLSRLNASPAEKAARQTRLATAVRTVLECIGEDPDREGLLRTPERYAKALMWMTKGYEDRLAGKYPPHFLHPSSCTRAPQTLKSFLLRRDQWRCLCGGS
jgi:GTP cyclohydrolase I